MKWLTNILASYNLSKELPKVALYGALGAALMLPLVCGKTTITKSITTTEYRDTGLSNIDSLLTLLREPKIIYRETIRTIVLDSLHDTLSSDIAYTEDSTDYPPDSEIIEAVENIRDEIADVPIEPFHPFGFRLDAILGPSLPGGTVIGAHAQAWFDRVSLFAYPRLVLPDFSRSSVDVGIGYRVF